jgi:hypothetical protein
MRSQRLALESIRQQLTAHLARVRALAISHAAAARRVFCVRIALATRRTAFSPL